MPLRLQFGQDTLKPLFTPNNAYDIPNNSMAVWVSRKRASAPTSRSRVTRHYMSIVNRLMVNVRNLQFLRPSSANKSVTLFWNQLHKIKLGSLHSNVRYLSLRELPWFRAKPIIRFPSPGLERRPLKRKYL